MAFARSLAVFVASLAVAGTASGQSAPKNLRGIEVVWLRVTVQAHEDQLDSVAIRKAIEGELQNIPIALRRPPLDSVHGATVQVNVGLLPLPAENGTLLGDFYVLTLSVARPARLYGTVGSGEFTVWSATVRLGYVPVNAHADRFVRDEAAATTRGFAYDYRQGNTP